MANPKIEVEIGAVIDGLKKGFGESVKIIETLEQQALELDKALRAATDLPTIQGLNTQLAQTKAALSQLKTTGIEPLTKATSNYNSVGTDFARIIQDAPFGIIGVGNNITQLAGSFQVLRNQTGSTGAAVKAALGSIFSSGNLLVLGISALTTVFTILQQKGFFDTEKAAKSLDERLSEYKDTLDSVNKSTLQGIQDSEGQLQKFRELVAQAENVNVSEKNRLAAVNELQKLYPQYLGNLTKEQILTGNVGDAYDILTKQIIANAKAKAFSDEITKNQTRLRALEKEQLENVNKIIEKREEIARRERSSNEAGLKVSGQLAATDFDLARAKEELNELIEKQTASIASSNKVKSDNIEIEKLINNELKNGAVFTKENTDAKDQNKKALEGYSESWDLYNLRQDTATKGTENLTLAQNALNKKIEETLKIIPTQPVKINFDGSPLSAIIGTIDQIINTTPSANKALENLGKTEVKVSDQPPVLEIPQIDNSKKSAFIKSLKDFNAEATAIVSSGTANTIGDIAFGIGQALANGTSVFKAAGRALLEGVAQIADGLGQAAIKVGIGMIAIKAAFKNPATAIAAGVALVALAGFIRAKIGGGGGGSIPSGGGGGSASVGGAGVGGGSSFVGGAQGGLFQQNRDVSGEFVVRGQDLVYVLGQANNRINKG
jgi:uncharacterized membrane protein (DUF106 family)